jgi:class 3 adenylate cyclase
MDNLARRILHRLNQPAESALALLEAYHTPDPASKKLWQKNPELYRRFADRLIEQGHPAQALDLAREREAYLKEHRPGQGDPLADDSRLRYLLARAAVRGGNPLYAQRLLRPLLELATGPDDRLPRDLRKNLKLRVDAIALMGRVFKDRSRGNPKLIPESITWYQHAAELPGADGLPDRGTYPLINLATMWRVFGDAGRARHIAEDVIQRVEPLLDAAVAQGDHWLPATRGEAAVLVDDHHTAVDWYLKAINIALSRHAVGDVSAILANLLRLAEVGATKDPTWVAEHVGSVVVFSGHMIDSPERFARGEPPRFPNHRPLAERLKKEIADRLDRLNARIGYSSLACGSDILFAEAMLARDAELHVVLPFAEADFLRQSVDFGLEKPMQNWRERFYGVKGQLAKDNLHHATTEPFLGTTELFDFVNAFTQGLAVLRARQRMVEPRALIVIDRQSTSGARGTDYFQKTWKKAGFEVDDIDLAVIRKRVVPGFASPVPSPPPEPRNPKLARRVKAMLFADVAGFSQIPERKLPGFLSQYFAFLKRMFQDRAGKRAIFGNTWGDGLYAVFDTVVDAAEFALTLLDKAAAGKVKWVGTGPGEVPLRIALHVGPVFELVDLFQGRPAYSGQHVNRTARIEPVTLPGCVYASEQFAALLTMHAPKRYACEFVGVQTLPKGYDRCPLHHITRA